MAESGRFPVQAGQLIAGKYRVERVIGVGGMGVVVAARHEQLDQAVAIKLVRGEVVGNVEAVERFLREARAAAKLKSEHAARVLDVGTLETGVPYMVMEFLEGSDLERVLAERAPLPVALAASWIAQACEALAEAHAAGIVHRDLKPQNLFLTRTVGGAEKVKVLDFGVSKSMETITHGPGALTGTRAMLGSPLYMSPEQMRSSRDVDARADIWGLGVVLFELLTQRWPFEADTLPELCLKVVSDPPRALSELRPDVPEQMVRVVERCLEKDVEKRFANAAELAWALEPMLPPASRIVVERARSAIANLPPTTTPLRSHPALERLSVEGTKIAPRVAPTPAAWGSGRAFALAQKRKSVTRFAWVCGLFATVVVTIAAWVWRGRPSAAPSLSASSSSMAPMAPPSTPIAERSAESAMSVVTLAQPANEVSPAVSTGVPADSASPATKRSAFNAPAASIGGVGVVARPPPVKEPTRDDDIPALR
jgi:serine/threonine-protein kinase